MMNSSEWQTQLNQVASQFRLYCQSFKTFEKQKLLIDKFQFEVMYLISKTTADEQANYILWFCANTLHFIEDIMTLQYLDLSQNIHNLRGKFCDLFISCSTVGNGIIANHHRTYLTKLDNFEKNFDLFNKVYTDCIEQLQESIVYFDCVSTVCMVYPQEEILVKTNGKTSIITRKIMDSDPCMSKANIHAQLFSSQITHNELHPGTSSRLLLIQIDEREQDLQINYNLAVKKYHSEIRLLQNERERLLRLKVIKRTNNTTITCIKLVDGSTPESLTQLVADLGNLSSSQIICELVNELTFESSDDQEVLEGEDRCGINYHGYNDWTDVDVWHQKELKTKQIYDSFVSKFQRVRQLRIDVDDPNDYSDVDNEEYYADMAWWNEHIRYLKSQPNYEPYIAATRDNDAVVFHPQLGPWTGPFRELTDSSMMAQYTALYEKDFELIESNRKALEMSRREAQRKKRKSREDGDRLP
jgi:hypothetical protein